MIKIDEELVADLKAVAEKHGITYETLCRRIRDTYDAEDCIENIRYVIAGEYPQIALTDENIGLIYARYIRKEDSEYGVWDNIRAAIEYLLNENTLELIEEEE